ncbi:MAG: hypothetical protein ABF746_08970 [Acetobacter orientalis]|uniref:hypothetical protein n=1 Tax=Acetobacter orientalis TaxID=146474 RepID=UPI0020A5F36A|nr:hypothetical protein [Acetobacter orientalis]MCP1222377.1 hypothetical protein [Acetobacter orientalis]
MHATTAPLRFCLGVFACLCVLFAPVFTSALVHAQPQLGHATMVHSACHSAATQPDCAAMPHPTHTPAEHGHEKCCDTHTLCTQSTAPILIGLPVLPLGVGQAALLPRASVHLVGTDRLPLLRPPKTQAA